MKEYFFAECLRTSIGLLGFVELQKSDLEWEANDFGKHNSHLTFPQILLPQQKGQKEPDEAVEGVISKRCPHVEHSNHAFLPEKAETSLGVFLFLVGCHSEALLCDAKLLEKQKLQSLSEQSFCFPQKGHHLPETTLDGVMSKIWPQTSHSNQRFLLEFLNISLGGHAFFSLQKEDFLLLAKLFKKHISQSSSEQSFCFPQKGQNWPDVMLEGVALKLCPQL